MDSVGTYSSQRGQIDFSLDSKMFFCVDWMYMYTCNE